MANTSVESHAPRFVATTAVECRMNGIAVYLKHAGPRGQSNAYSSSSGAWRNRTFPSVFGFIIGLRRIAVSLSLRFRSTKQVLAVENYCTYSHTYRIGIGPKWTVGARFW